MSKELSGFQTLVALKMVISSFVFPNGHVDACNQLSKTGLSDQANDSVYIKTFIDGAGGEEIQEAEIRSLQRLTDAQ
jgi:hypothetical protein